MLTGFDLCRAALAVHDVSAPEQSVLMVLAIMANDAAQCWPPINGPQGLTGKTKLSERTVQMAVKSLAAAGHIARHERAGRGVIYTVHPRISCTPAEHAPVQEMRPAGGAPTPAPRAPKQPRTTIPTKASPSSVTRQRGTRVSPNFDPLPSPGSLTAKVMDGWPPGEREKQVEHFVDHHTAKGTISLDWQASWRTWVKNWKSFNGQRSHHQRRSGNGLLDAVLDAEHARRAG